jgi:hypothetical protein
VLRPSTVVADNAAFVGVGGERALQIAAALTAAQPELAARVQIVPGVEIRSAGDLQLSSDWNLMPSTAGRDAGPATLTLRAAGNLVISNSLSDGFVAAAGSADSRAIVANGVAKTDGASYRLVAGADLSSADPMAVHTDSAGTLTIGRAATPRGTPPSVYVRTTTGSIEMAAASDIVQLNSQARVYTTGTPVARSELPEFGRLVFSINQLARGEQTGTTSGPFYENAGDITLQAGRDLRGAPGTTYNASGTGSSTQYVTDWWYRQTGVNSPEQPAALWSRYDLFGQGFASFGSGDILASAGRDIVDLELSTPTTGYRLGARVSDSVVVAPAAQRWFQGGDLDVAAGRNVVSGLFNAGGARARLVAGDSILGSGDSGLGRSHPATQVLYQGTDWNLRARQSLTIGSPTNPALLPGVVQGSENNARVDLVDGLAPAASVSLVTLTGDLELSTSRPALRSGDTRFLGVGGRVLPDDLQAIAFSGSIDAGVLVQRPSGQARLDLLAGRDVQIDTLQLTGMDGAAAPRPLASADLAAVFNPSIGRWNVIAPGQASPVVMVAEGGDLSFGSGSESFSARPLRLIALRDLDVVSSLRVQHEPAGDGQPAALTLLQAGRDVRFARNSSLRLGGPGDLLIAAGRDVDLGGSPGVVTVGNQDNPRGLPAGGASISVLAGIDLRAADYRDAAGRQFQLVGGGFTGVANELLVQLEALRDGSALLSGKALAEAARAVAALTPAERGERVRALVGAQAFDRDVQAYVAAGLARIDALSAASDALQAAGTPARVPGSQFLNVTTGPGGVPLSAAEARTRLAAALAEQAYGSVLARHLADSAFDTAGRSAVALSVSAYTPRLIEFMQRQGAPAGLSAAESAQRFGLLSPERQALFINEVLFAELRAAGRSSTQGDRVAYLRGYEALDGLFAGERAAGDISLSSSQFKTQQGGNILMLAPAGGVNVGELGASGLGRTASDLGIVTVAGGSIEAAVRSNLDVNQSRVFTLARGDLLLWSSVGNLDAGRGAKTVTGSPPPLFTINDKGQLVIDTSGSFSGSGIAVLDGSSSLDLYAPLGEINAGDAGIQSRGITFLGANRIVNADALSLSGPTVGAPPPAPTSSANASLGAAAQSATSAGSRAQDEESEEDKRKKRRARRNLLLDFLGFGAESK